MSSIIIITVICLSLLAFTSSVILFYIAQKFSVEEDPRIDVVHSMLPAANCGGCGFAGCRNLAEELVKADSLDRFICPVGGSETMKNIADFLGKTVPVVEPKVAVLLCNGTLENRPVTTVYDGAKSCRIANSLYMGQTDCSYGCFGHGDCVSVCKFDAIHIDISSGLPVVSDEKCNACGACVKACPRNLIELRKKAKKDRKIYVACSNCDKGGIARKACSVACIACTKCLKVCAFDAIKIENNLAYIDATKCTFCRKCVEACPTGSILEFNFPVRKPVSENAIESKTV
jgi:Na+-translocating ferredoxin:NAD+ oxidoreductase subunit B